MLKEEGPEEEFALRFKRQPVIVPEMAGDHRMVEGLFCDEAFELMFCVEALKKRRDRTIEKKNPQHQ